MMVFGLIEQADRMGKSAQGTQRALTEQIQELAQLQEWTVNAAMELQKRPTPRSRAWRLSGCSGRVLEAVTKRTR